MLLCIPMNKSGQIKIVQTLRGIAAVMVMIYHKRAALDTMTKPFGELFFGAASMGVDLFFIISGFIMVMVNERNPKNISNVQGAWEFFTNRISRILPLYYLTIGIFYILSWRGFSFLWDVGTTHEIGKSFMFIPLHFSREAPFYGYAAITVGWTLNYEMFFYLLLTISLLFGKYRYWIFSVLILVLLILVPLVFKGNLFFDAQHHYHFGWGYLNLMTNPIIWEFVAGMLLGAWYVYRKPHWSKPVYWLLFAMFGTLVGLQLLGKWNGGHGMTHWGFPLLGLVVSLVFYENQYGMKVSRWLLFLGKISFSIYLLHPVVQFVVQYRLAPLYWSSLPNTSMYVLVSSLLTIGIATLTQYLIENRFSNLFKNFLLYCGKKLKL